LPTDRYYRSEESDGTQIGKTLKRICDMEIIDERQNAERLLMGLENGGIPAADTLVLAEGLDPVLIYVIVAYLRDIHPATDPAASSVLERVVQLTSQNLTLVRKHREGEQDPVSRWFESEYSYRDYKGRSQELIELIVDKLNS